MQASVALGVRFRLAPANDFFILCKDPFYKNALRNT